MPLGHLLLMLILPTLKALVLCSLPRLTCSGVHIARVTRPITCSKIPLPFLSVVGEYPGLVSYRHWVAFIKGVAAPDVCVQALERVFAPYILGLLFGYEVFSPQAHVLSDWLYWEAVVSCRSWKGIDSRRIRLWKVAFSQRNESMPLRESMCSGYFYCLLLRS